MYTVHVNKIKLLNCNVVQTGQQHGMKAYKQQASLKLKAKSSRSLASPIYVH